jgi:putative transposase
LIRLTCSPDSPQFELESFEKEEEDEAQSVYEEQVIGILREHEAGAKAADLCRKHGVSSATFYKWNATYGGMNVSQARKLKVLEGENSWLKRLLAEAMLDNCHIAWSPSDIRVA